MVLNFIQVDRRNALSGPRLEPPLIKFSVVNRHKARNAVPFIGSRNNSEPPVCGCPSDVVVKESNAVSVRETDIPRRDRVEVIHRETVDEIRIPVFAQGNLSSSVPREASTATNPTPNADQIQYEPFGPGQHIELLLRTFDKDHKIPKFLSPFPHSM